MGVSVGCDKKSSQEGRGWECVGSHGLDGSGGPSGRCRRGERSAVMVRICGSTGRGVSEACTAVALGHFSSCAPAHLHQSLAKPSRRD